MMPNAKGAKETRFQILIYTGLFLLAVAAPVFTGLGGWVYALSAGFGGALFALLAVRVFRSKAGEVSGSADELYAVRSGDKAARDLFAYSIGYLTVIFAALLAEHGFALFWPVLGGVS